MRNNNKTFARILLIISLIATAYIAINTQIVKPSLGSRIARTIASKFIAPPFANIESAEPIRERLELLSKFFILPLGTRVKEVTIGNMKADIVAARGVDPKSKKILLFFHGGAFFAGSRNTHRELVSRISAASGLPVLVPEYRLAPEYKFPAANDDCLAAYDWLIAQGYEQKHIALGGDSAGGGLALMTLISLRDAGKPLPGTVILLSPLTDMANYDGETWTTKKGVDPVFPNTDNVAILMGRYIGGPGKKSPLLSPVQADLRELPPMLIHVGTDEILLSDSTRLAERAQKAGVDVTLKVWEDMYHVF